jgi:hypothetical protein
VFRPVLITIGQRPFHFFRFPKVYSASGVDAAWFVHSQNSICLDRVGMEGIRGANLDFISAAWMMKF